MAEAAEILVRERYRLIAHGVDADDWERVHAALGAAVGWQAAWTEAAQVYEREAAEAAMAGHARTAGAHARRAALYGRLADMDPNRPGPKAPGNAPPDDEEVALAEVWAGGCTPAPEFAQVAFEGGVVRAYARVPREGVPVVVLFPPGFATGAEGQAGSAAQETVAGGIREEAELYEVRLLARGCAVLAVDVPQGPWTPERRSSYLAAVRDLIHGWELPWDNHRLGVWGTGSSGALALALWGTEPGGTAAAVEAHVLSDQEDLGQMGFGRDEGVDTRARLVAVYPDPVTAGSMGRASADTLFKPWIGDGTPSSGVRRVSGVEVRPLPEARAYTPWGTDLVADVLADALGAQEVAGA